jgi:hypothetical protein
MLLRSALEAFDLKDSESYSVVNGIMQILSGKISSEGMKDVKKDVIKLLSAPTNVS